MVLAPESPYQPISTGLPARPYSENARYWSPGRSSSRYSFVREVLNHRKDGFGLVELRRWRRLDGLLPGIPPINSNRHSFPAIKERERTESRTQILLDKLLEMMQQHLPSEQVVFRNLLMCYKQQLSSTQRVVCRLVPQEKTQSQLWR